MQMKRRGFLGRLSLLGAMPAAAAGAERDGRLPAAARDLLEEIAAREVYGVDETSAHRRLRPAEGDRGARRRTASAPAPGGRR